MTAPRELPAVHRLLADPRVADVVGTFGRERVVAALRMELDARRRRLTTLETAERRDGPDAEANGAHDSVVEGTLGRLADLRRPRPAHVVNATGVILHTNLGRAPVSAAAAQAMAQAAGAYSDLEFDLATGERGSRHALLEGLLTELTGAEAGLVVNNNAGATLLVLAALAAGKGVVVSRGQLIEIGDGFRLPTIFEAGGARLVEVGTTNRTKLSDYEAALNDDTVSLILRVHSSNFRVIGFTAEVGIEALAALGHRAGLPVVDDLGSGSLLDTSAFGLRREPIVGESIAAGADLVTFSGDKLLGGPQAGIIVGRRDLVARLRRHPLTRALRPGKDVIAGLHATLLSYVVGKATEEIPVWQMIAARPEALAERAVAWRKALVERGVAGERLQLVAGESAIGGGSLPGEALPTTLVALEAGMEAGGADGLAARLRTGEPAVVARIADGRVVLDPRTVLAGEDEALLAAVARETGGL